MLQIVPFHRGVWRLLYRTATGIADSPYVVVTHYVHGLQVAGVGGWVRAMYLVSNCSIQCITSV